MRRALVTGCAGFVGRHMVTALHRDGWRVHGFDIVPPANPELNVRWTADARDFFRSNQRHYDLVVHCAAVVGGRATIEGAPMKVAVDLAIDAEMFNWALRTGQERVVYYSSSAVYPCYLQTPDRHERLREDLVRPDARKLVGVPDMSYGWAKLTGEKLAVWAAAEGLAVHVFRPFSGYGTDQATDYPFPAFIERAAKRADPFVIWGSGAQCRDWIHIDDVTAATLAAVEADVRGPVNLCSGKGVSFLELAAKVCRLAGYNPELCPQPGAPTGVHYRVGDPTAMLRFYQPQVSLEQGIARALELPAVRA